MINRYDVCVIGGAGHVGAPLALVLANRGVRTLICDIDERALKLLSEGEMPFVEEGGEVLLGKALAKQMLGFSSHIRDVVDVPVLILTIGTPIDEFHNPVLSLLTRCIDEMMPFLSDAQIIILRSTVAPGTTDYLDRYLKAKDKKTRVAFCPERVVQGKAIQEIQTLPQIVSGTSIEAKKIAGDLFIKIAPQIVEASTKQAEFAKLICNAYRYIQFAATNQLFMMVESSGLNYNELLNIMKIGYPRMGSIPGPGFAAGPCLMKDTMQLFSLDKHSFILGQVAMTINEGLPNFLVQRLALHGDLSEKTIGVLGMAFKADSDDLRDSLSYKLVKILRFSGASVICSDEYIKDPAFVSKEALIKHSDIIIIGVPHNSYRSLEFPSSIKVIDLWNLCSTTEKQ